MAPTVSRRLVLGSLLALPLAACSSAKDSSGSAGGASGGRTVIDSTGAKVALPAEIHRVADAWQAHNEVVAMLGAGDTMVATVSTKKLVPWLYQVNPHMADAKTVFTNTSVDVEGLLATRPDVIFLPTNSKVADGLKDVQVPVVQLNFKSYEGLKKVITLTGEVLGGTAVDRAKRYNAELTATLSKITARTSSLPAAQRPKVLHVTSLDPLVVDGTSTIVDAWITAAGGRNAATVAGNNVTVGKEQLLSWDPEVLILGTNTLVDPHDPGKARRDLLADPGWRDVAAIRSQRVYVNPIGAFFWDRYSAETILQLQWVATQLHPQTFRDLDVAAATRSFYQTYFGYHLTDDQVTRILTAHQPA